MIPDKSGNCILYNDRRRNRYLQLTICLIHTGGAVSRRSKTTNVRIPLITGKYYQNIGPVLFRRRFKLFLVIPDYRQDGDNTDPTAPS